MNPQSQGIINMPAIEPTTPAPQPTTPPAQVNDEAPKAPGDRPATDYPDHGDFETHEIIYTNSGGKESFKLKGGPFAKFGITVYPEMLEGKGVNLGEIKKAGTLPFRAKVEWYTAESKNGFYKRVKDIVLLDEEEVPW